MKLDSLRDHSVHQSISGGKNDNLKFKMFKKQEKAKNFTF